MVLMDNILQSHHRTKICGFTECIHCVTNGSDTVRFEQASDPIGQNQYISGLSKGQRPSQSGSLETLISGHSSCCTLVPHTSTDQSLKEDSVQEVSATKEADKGCFFAAVDPMTKTASYPASQCPTNELRLLPTESNICARQRIDVLSQLQRNAIVFYNSMPADSLVKVVQINNFGGEILLGRKNSTNRIARTVCLKKAIQLPIESSARGDPSRADGHSTVCDKKKTYTLIFCFELKSNTIAALK